MAKPLAAIQQILRRGPFPLQSDNIHLDVARTWRETHHPATEAMKAPRPEDCDLAA